MPADSTQYVVTIPGPPRATRTAEIVEEELQLEGIKAAIARSAFAAGAIVELKDPKHFADFHDDFGIPLDVGLPRPVQVFSRGAWTYTEESGRETHGNDFGMLVLFVLRRSEKLWRYGPGHPERSATDGV